MQLRSCSVRSPNTVGMCSQLLETSSETTTCEGVVLEAEILIWEEDAVWLLYEEIQPFPT